MTVFELISKLQSLPGGAAIVLYEEFDLVEAVKIDLMLGAGYKNDLDEIVIGDVVAIT